MIQSDSYNPYLGMAHTLTQSRVLLLSILNIVLPVFSQSDTSRKSAPFQVGQSLNPCPSRYRMAFAFSDISFPHSNSVSYDSPALIRRRYRVSTFHINDPMNDLGVPWTPTGQQFRVSTLETYSLPVYMFTQRNTSSTC